MRFLGPYISRKNREILEQMARSKDVVMAIELTTLKSIQFQWETEGASHLPKKTRRVPIVRGCKAGYFLEGKRSIEGGQHCKRKRSELSRACGTRMCQEFRINGL